MTTTTKLPLPDLKGSGATIEKCLAGRRSARSFQAKPITVRDFSQLLWAGQGVSHHDFEDPMRTAPSAGALYPLEMVAVVSGVDGLSQPGVYSFDAEAHAIKLLRSSAAALTEIPGVTYGQDWIARAPVVFVLLAVISRTAIKYGASSRTYIAMEVGHAAENILLQAESLGLRGTMVAAISDRPALQRILAVDASWEPFALIPVGVTTDF